MTDNSKRTGAAVEAHYQFLAWLVQAVEKFPKSDNFTLGERIENIALDVLGDRRRWLVPGERDRVRRAHARGLSSMISC